MTSFLDNPIEQYIQFNDKVGADGKYRSIGCQLYASRSSHTVMVKSIHTVRCIKQSGQLLTLANNNLVCCDYHKTTHDVISPPYQNVSKSIIVNKASC